MDSECRPTYPLLTPLASTNAPPNIPLKIKQLMAFTGLKNSLPEAPALGRPLYNRLFQLYVTIEDGCATAVLNQTHGDRKQPVAYFSTKLDLVAAGFLPCSQVLPAIHVLVSAASNITLRQLVGVLTTHSVVDLLTSRQSERLTQTRQNKYEAALLNKPTSDLFFLHHPESGHFPDGTPTASLIS
ncbi:hypothetical protein chiPu_0004167 [Chiloscyllium punctatum]|uniref:Reverse transcriptase/retrotransposon-derived protein RNase H-like domain-containing protein n=1 Tax=Chiloscyllium punctatum TaxID=137246 RepID=A0A401S5U4_CHIPU|nr:hypothetical protein [Chiloscyllium punctatum]